MKKDFFVITGIVLLTVLGFWQFGKGAYITVKAHVAQRLLEHAWQNVLAGSEDSKPWPWADTTPVARLRVPSLGIDQIVLSGSSDRNLAFGPTHLEASQLPGAGTSIFSGHRDTHFSFLQHMRKNDQIIVQTADGLEHTFRVSHMEIADTRSSQLKLDNGATLVLVTCYPFNVIAPTGPLRYVVTAAPALP